MSKSKARTTHCVWVFLLTCVCISGALPGTMFQEEEPGVFFKTAVEKNCKAGECIRTTYKFIIQESGIIDIHILREFIEEEHVTESPKKRLEF